MATAAPIVGEPAAPSTVADPMRYRGAITKVAPVQADVVSWLLAAMHWGDCRHAYAPWRKPLHPPTGVVRRLSGIDVAEQSDHPRDILTKVAERRGAGRTAKPPISSQQ
ncbi:hypothetical protein CS8_001210 [Cupriavidus sp. 8B]